MLAWSDGSGDVRAGTVTAHHETPLNITVQNSTSASGSVYATRGFHEVNVTGTAGGVSTSAATRVSIENVNAMTAGGAVQRVDATIRHSMETGTTRSETVAPLTLSIAANETALAADQDYARERVFLVGGTEMKWRERMAGAAALTSSGASGDGGAGATRSTFDVVVNGTACYSRRASARNGSVASDDESSFACQMPAGYRFCGDDVCGAGLTPEGKSSAGGGGASTSSSEYDGDRVTVAAGPVSHRVLAFKPPPRRRRGDWR